MPEMTESDCESEDEGPAQPSDGGEDPGTGRRVRRKTINELEGEALIRDKAQRKVNDDEEEKKWASILVQAVEGGGQEEDAQRIFDDLTGKELDPKKVKEARRGETDSVKRIKAF